MKTIATWKCLLAAAGLAAALLVGAPAVRAEAADPGEPAQPDDGAPVLVVHGQVFLPGGTTPLEDGKTVAAINTRTGQVATGVVGAISPLHYELVFIDPLGGEAALAGDVLAFRVERAMLSGQSGLLELDAADVAAGIVAFDMVLDGYVGVPEAAPAARLLGNRPNPFNPRTEIRFALDEDRDVLLTVHDLRGRLVRPLLAERRAAGAHAVTWDGRDAGGREMPSAVYLVKLETGDGTAARKIMLVR